MLRPVLARPAPAAPARAARTAGLPLLLLLVLALLAGGCGQSRQSGQPTATAAQPASGGGGAVPDGPHPAPAEEVYKGCPAQGDGTDPVLNQLKNRVDSGDWQPVSVSALLALTWPPGVNNTHMTNWRPTDRSQVDTHNGVPVRTEGVLLQVRQEGPESPNCHSADAADMDFHTWLAAAPGDDRATRSVVIEFTPRVRARHPGWTLAALQDVARRKSAVRVSGWTLLDPEHPEEVGKSRGTIWEIHPVMRVEVQQPGGDWKEL